MDNLSCVILVILTYIVWSKYKTTGSIDYVHISTKKSTVLFIFVFLDLQQYTIFQYIHLYIDSQICNNILGEINTFT